MKSSITVRGLVKTKSDIGALVSYVNEIFDTTKPWDTSHNGLIEGHLKQGAHVVRDKKRKASTFLTLLAFEASRAGAESPKKH